MKFSAPSRSTSFYESFSDLIFATMAIFVLIIIVLIIQVRPEGVPKEKYDDALSEIESEKKKSQQKDEEIEELEKKVESLISTSAMELIVIVDGSGSMGHALKALSDSIVDVAESLPLAASEFSLGLIIYRSKLEIFPGTRTVKRIMKRNEDNGRSLQEVANFTRKMKPISGLANIDAAILESLSMFSSGSSKKSLVIIGDVGPYEYSSQGKNYVNCADSVREQRLISAVKQFAAREEKFSLFTLYTGDDTPQFACPSQTQVFFTNLASLLDDNGGYSADISKLFLFLLKGVLGEK